MPEDLLPPPSDPNPPTSDPPTPARPRKLVCEFCECTLAPTGEVLKRGDEARRLSRLDETLESVRAELARAQAELAAATDELRAQSSRSESGVRIPI